VYPVSKTSGGEYGLVPVSQRASSAKVTRTLLPTPESVFTKPPEALFFPPIERFVTSKSERSKLLLNVKSYASIFPFPSVSRVTAEVSMTLFVTESVTELSEEYVRLSQIVEKRLSGPPS
jgi:hypothetical protein